MAGVGGIAGGWAEAEADVRQEVKGRLDAAKQMQDLADAPVDREFKQAQTSNLWAAAAEKQRKNTQAMTLHLLGQKSAVERGIPLSANEAQRALEGSPSQATQLERMARMGEAEGVGADTLVPIYKTIAEIKQKEASSAAAQATEAVRLEEAQMKSAKRYGSLAQAALESPQAWAQIRMSTPGLERLPATLEAARPGLQMLIAASQDTIAYNDQRRKEREEKVRKALADSTIARNQAAVGVSKARQAKLETEHTMVKKYGGNGDPLTQALKRQKLRAGEALLEQRWLAVAPHLPTEDNLIVGQVYTLPGGKGRVQWVEDAEGNKGAIPYRGQLEELESELDAMDDEGAE